MSVSGGFDRAAGLRIGLDLGGTKIERVVLDADEIEHFRSRRPTPSGDYNATVRALAELVLEVDAEIGVKAPVGIGIPGTISTATGFVKNANSTCLIGKPFDRDLEVAIGRPVKIANDANCFTLSESIDGAGKGYHSVFGVILGTGTGSGVNIGGRILEGRNGIGGEWGHNPLPWPSDDERPGRTCYCGQTGCIETFLSGSGLVHDYKVHTGRDMTADSIAAAAVAGDAQANNSLTRYEDRLARALAGVINILDPDIIVVGGGLSIIERLYANVPKRWSAYVFSDQIETRLVAALHGDASGVRGAARLWDQATGDLTA
jgi:fructokinase